MSKTIKISNGEVRIGYEFDELSEEAKNKVIEKFISYAIEDTHVAMCNDEDHPLIYLVHEMEEMQTPWFLGQVVWEKESDFVMGMIKDNGYLFDEDGNIIPIRYHYKGDELVKTSFGDKEYFCVIEEMKLN